MEQPNSFSTFGSGQQQQPPPRQSKFVLRLIWSVILLVLVISAAYRLTWFIIGPRSPVFVVTSVSVSNLSTSSDGQGLLGSYDIGFSVKNPNNKIDLLLESFRVSVGCGRQARFSQSKLISMQVFEIERASTKNASAKMYGTTVGFGGGDCRRRHVLNLRKEMRVKLKYTVGKWPSKRNSVNLRCPIFKVEFVDGRKEGKLQFRGKKSLVCHVS